MQTIQINNTYDILDIEVEDIQRLYRWAKSVVTIHDMKRKKVEEECKNWEIANSHALDEMAKVISDFYPLCVKIVALFENEPCIL